jgi:hypothetical protein
MLEELIKQGTADFWLAGVENSCDGKGLRFNFIGSDGKRSV